MTRPRCGRCSPGPTRRCRPLSPERRRPDDPARRPHPEIRRARRPVRYRRTEGESDPPRSPGAAAVADVARHHLARAGRGDPVRVGGLDEPDPPRPVLGPALADRALGGLGQLPRCLALRRSAALAVAEPGVRRAHHRDRHTVGSAGRAQREQPILRQGTGAVVVPGALRHPDLRRRHRLANPAPAQWPAQPPPAGAGPARRRPLADRPGQLLDAGRRRRLGLLAVLPHDARRPADDFHRDLRSGRSRRHHVVAEDRAYRSTADQRPAQPRPAAVDLAALQQLHSALPAVRQPRTRPGERLADQHLPDLISGVPVRARRGNVHRRTDPHRHPRPGLPARRAPERPTTGGVRVVSWHARAPEAVLPSWLRRGAITLIGGFALVPVLFMVLLSVTPDDEVAGGGLWPTHFEFDNYVKLWSTVPLASGLFNSMFVALVAAIIATMFAVGAAYCLTRFTFIGRRPFLSSLVMVQSLPQTLLILPLFVVLASVGSALGITIVGSRGGLILTYLSFALPLATWVMVTYLRRIPESLEEAGLV